MAALARKGWPFFQVLARSGRLLLEAVDEEIKLFLGEGLDLIHGFFRRGHIGEITHDILPDQKLDLGEHTLVGHRSLVAGNFNFKKICSGENLWDFLSEHIFRPLGMKSVWNSDQKELAAVDATPYVRNALGPLRVAPNEGIGWMFAAGELAMTAHDLALWDESLIAQSILKPESYKAMFTEVKPRMARARNTASA